MMGDYDAHELPDEPGFLSRYRLVESDDDEPPPLVDASDDSESDDEDVERTKMSSADTLNVESLLLASETCPRRLELYDSGATNMFRALATNAIAGSERPLARVRKVAAADSGLTAERTYLETFNMLSADGTAIYSAIISV